MTRTSDSPSPSTERKIDWKKVWAIARLLVLLAGLVIVTFMFRRVPPVEVLSVTPATALDDHFQPVSSTDQYAPGDSFFVSVELRGYQPRHQLFARWKYEGQVITTTRLETQSAGQGFAGFVLRNEDGDWPVGKYSVEILFDDEILGSASFRVEAAAGE